jgi:ferric-dicitrate binding protein FerR (iron transport regulator)
MSDRRNDDVDRHSDMPHFDDPDRDMDDELLFRSATGRATPKEQRAVAEWLGDAVNEQHYRELVGVLKLTADADDRLGFGPPPSANDMLARSGRRFTRFTRTTRHGRPGRDWRALFALAAGVAGIGFALTFAPRLLPSGSAPAGAAATGSDEFSTETQSATVEMRDGSVVRLAPATRLRVHARQDGREVTLTGRGFFAVAPDPAVPFTIHSDAGTVTVLGTRFDLAVNGQDLRLIVVEGTVRLTVRGAQVLVRAGQVAQVLRGNIVPPVEVPDPASLIGWMGNFIAFQETPLPAAVREIEQRYGIRIELTAPELADRTVTALFAGRTYTEIVEVICVVANLECTKVGDVLRMAPAR